MENRDSKNAEKLNWILNRVFSKSGEFSRDFSFLVVDCVKKKMLENFSNIKDGMIKDLM
jgi:hypothetical protein